MATRIMARRPTPKFRRAVTPRPATPTGDAARSLLENKATQLRTLLWCCYGDCSEWFEDIGPMRRDHIMWIAADMAEEVEELVQGYLGE